MEYDSKNTSQMIQKTIRYTVPFYKCDEFEDPLRVEEIIMDCSNCKYNLACCKIFTVPLLPSEISKYKTLNGTAQLDKNEDGSCTYHKNEKCSIWYDRPVACREFTCDGDERIESENIEFKSRSCFVRGLPR
jgi:Fe-S-cluster containining protein